MVEVVEPHTYRFWPGLGQDLAGLLFWRFTVGLAVFSGVLAMAIMELGTMSTADSA